MRHEHNHIAEQLLGRLLRPEEEIHHVDGRRDHNVTEGPFLMDERGRLRSGILVVRSSSQPRGQEVGPKLDYALEILELYVSHLGVDRTRRLRPRRRC